VHFPLDVNVSVTALVCEVMEEEGIDVTPVV